MSHASAEVLIAPGDARTTTSVALVTETSWEAVRESLDAIARSACDIAGFKGKAGQCVTLPGDQPR
ncbi:hypothetical protein, partial [Salmonella enterica]|uniref:hypothetical protein n=1 Tax=Salmonella enterica TaxID=28901 RepID=UPI003D2C44F9